MLNIRGILTKKDPDYIPEFERQWQQIIDRQAAFWNAREQESVRFEGDK